MTDNKPHCLYGETLITLAEAAKDFGGVPISLSTIKKYVYRGVDGLKLESVSLNGRYTSREALNRFINPKGQCQLGLCYLDGRGCRQDIEVAFQWITSAASTGHPAVVLLLQQVGLDIGKIVGGYKQAWDRFGENFEQVFCKSQ